MHRTCSGGGYYGTSRLAHMPTIGEATFRREPGNFDESKVTAVEPVDRGREVAHAG
jgi:hypothetical protein